MPKVSKESAAQVDAHAPVEELRLLAAAMMKNMQEMQGA
jgi:hypothetical protein